ncbi:hypothetical protein O181_056701 [Austropuccinia psidii MF-1]|uniref:Uncharacterized protein n=1 Tax=Austropuccinia psidii MF-1 TaxID=1389203 RepID=A0A9Q3HT85_9BASI|nr:hypothetical protein [Austropuccinia psidii MF-1]
MNEPVQEVSHIVQGERLENVATNPPRSDELLVHSQKIPKRGINCQILQWMESNIIQTTNQKYERLEQQKERGNKGKSLSSFYKQATNQPTHSRGEKEQKELEATIFPKLQDPKNP